MLEGKTRQTLTGTVSESAGMCVIDRSVLGEDPRFYDLVLQFSKDGATRLDVLVEGPAGEWAPWAEDVLADSNDAVVVISVGFFPRIAASFTGSSGSAIVHYLAVPKRE